MKKQEKGRLHVRKYSFAQRTVNKSNILSAVKSKNVCIVC